MAKTKAKAKKTTITVRIRLRETASYSRDVEMEPDAYEKLRLRLDGGSADCIFAAEEIAEYCDRDHPDTIPEVEVDEFERI